jgi:hypothetical protein
MATGMDMKLGVETTTPLGIFKPPVKGDEHVFRKLKIRFSLGYAGLRKPRCIKGSRHAASTMALGRKGGPNQRCFLPRWFAIPVGCSLEGKPGFFAPP